MKAQRPKQKQDSDRVRQRKIPQRGNTEETWEPIPDERSARGPSRLRSHHMQRPWGLSEPWHVQGAQGT